MTTFIQPAIWRAQWAFTANGQTHGQNIPIALHYADTISIRWSTMHVTAPNSDTRVLCNFSSTGNTGGDNPYIREINYCHGTKHKDFVHYGETPLPMPFLGQAFAIEAAAFGNGETFWVTMVVAYNTFASLGWNDPRLNPLDFPPHV